MKHLFRTLVIGLGIVFTTTLLSQDAHEVFARVKKNTNPSGIQLESFSAMANCEGPNGQYTTLIESEGDKIYFEQNFTYRSEPSIIQASGQVTEFQSFFAHAHHFIRQAVDPSYLLPIVSEVALEDGIFLIKGKTWLNHSLNLLINEKSGLPESYELKMEGEKPIEVEFTEWKNQEQLLIPFRVKIKQGDDVFTFQYAKVMVNQKLARFEEKH